MLKRIFLLLIKIYQISISPKTGIFRFIYFFPTQCRFEESCSDFSYRQIREKGVFPGLRESFQRIKKCHKL